MAIYGSYMDLNFEMKRRFFLIEDEKRKLVNALSTRIDQNTMRYKSRSISTISERALVQRAP